MTYKYFFVIIFIIFLIIGCNKDENPTQPQQEGKTKPLAPLLISPTNNSDSISQNPVLIWNSSKWAESYSLQVAKNSSFTSNIILSLSNLIDTSYSLSILDFDERFYWRVNATNSIGTSDWSPAYNFRVSSKPNNPPNVPFNPSPGNNSYNIQANLKLAWECSDPDLGDTLTFKIVLTSDNFTFVDSNFKGTSYPYPGKQEILEYQKNYNWKIIATDQKGSFKESPNWQFKTRYNPWILKSPMPTARYRFATAVVNNKIYTIGGRAYGAGTVNNVEVYDPTNDSWSTKEPMPTPRFDCSATVYDGKIFVFGGNKNGVGDVSKDVEIYNPTTDSWEIKNEMPLDRTFFSAVTLTDKIYLMGGLNSNLGFLGLIEEYNPITDTYFTLPYSTFPRSRSAAVVYNNKIYILGGFNVLNLETASTLVEEFNPISGSIIQKCFIPGYPLGKSNLGASLVGDKVYIVGTTTADYNSATLIYDLLDNSFVEKGPLKQRKTGFGQAYVLGKIFIFGGNVSGGTTYSDETEMYESSFDP